MYYDDLFAVIKLIFLSKSFDVQVIQLTHHTCLYLHTMLKKNIPDYTMLDTNDVWNRKRMDTNYNDVR